MIKDISKELKYGLRNSRFLILLISFLFFALLTPVMMKVVLPEVLKSQFPGMTVQQLQGMMNMTQLGSVQSYMGDIFEIGSIIVAFSLCGLMAQEIKDNTLVMPLCSGKRFGGIIGAKMLVFGFVLVLVPLITLIIDYTYAGLLFSFDIGIRPIVRGGLLQGVYMVFLLACVVMWGTLVKRPVAAGFMTLATAFGLHFVGGLLDAHEYLPSGLLNEAQKLSETPASSLSKTLFITIGIIIAFMIITLTHLRSMEWNER